MCDTKSIQIFAAVAILIFALVAPSIFGAKRGFESASIAVAKAAEEVQAGYIIDKEIVIKPGTCNYGPFDMDYWLIIQHEFNHEGKVYEKTVSIPVDEDTYWKAQIGEWFDSRALEVSEMEMSEPNSFTISTSPSCRAESYTPYCGNCVSPKNQEN